MQRFTLSRHMSRRLTLCRRVGPCAPETPVRISVLLHAKDARALRDAVHDVSDPKADGYGRHLSPDQVRDLVAPGYQDLDAVLAFLRDSGLRIEGVSGARTAVQASGPAEAVARAFDAPIGLFAAPKAVTGGRRRAYGIERDPTIPASLAPVIRGVAGLNDLPAALRFPPLLAPKRSRVPRRGPAQERGPGGGYTPAEIHAAYDVSGDVGSGGRGERVAILEFGGGFSSADFSSFCAAYGLPAADVTEVSVSGAKNDYRGQTGDADVEVALDMDWVRASAPEAEMDLWWAPNVDTGWVDFLAALLDAPEARRPSVVSISWGMPEGGFSTSRRYDQTRQLFQSCALLGITFVCASGDAGAADELPDDSWYDGQRHVDFPSVVPEVTSVGGTKLLPAARGFSETARRIRRRLLAPHRRARLAETRRRGPRGCYGAWNSGRRRRRLAGPGTLDLRPWEMDGRGRHERRGPDLGGLRRAHQRGAGRGEESAPRRRERSPLRRGARRLCAVHGCRARRQRLRRRVGLPGHEGVGPGHGARVSGRDAPHPLSQPLRSRMFIGHAAVGFASKAAAPRASLGWLLAAPFLLDLLWPVFLLLGIERASIERGPNAFLNLSFDSYPWSHSLAMAIVWALLYGALAHFFSGSATVGWVAGLGVVSHWICDAIVHRPDLPLWPGSSVFVGMGLWNSVPGTLAVELPMLAAGI